MKISKTATWQQRLDEATIDLTKDIAKMFCEELDDYTEFYSDTVGRYYLSDDIFDSRLIRPATLEILFGKNYRPDQGVKIGLLDDYLNGYKYYEVYFVDPRNPERLLTIDNINDLVEALRLIENTINNY